MSVGITEEIVQENELALLRGLRGTMMIDGGLFEGQIELPIDEVEQMIVFLRDNLIIDQHMFESLISEVDTFVMHRIINVHHFFALPRNMTVPYWRMLADHGTRVQFHVWIEAIYQEYFSSLIMERLDIDDEVDLVEWNEMVKDIMLSEENCSFAAAAA